MMDSETIAAAMGRYHKPRAKISGCIRIVAEETGISKADILSKKRDHRTSRARQLAMWMARQEGYSLPQIGRVFGRDHTTILHGVRQIEKRINARYEVAGEILANKRHSC